MKNVFFAIAFILVGTVNFANSKEVEAINENLTLENYQICQSEEVLACFDFTLSCGAGGTACGDDLEEVIDLILWVDDLLC